MLTKRRFLLLSSPERHKTCALLLRAHYEAKTTDLSDYNFLTNLLNLHPYPFTTFQALADRYHFHLQQAGLSIKEHHLLPSLRTEKQTPIEPFLPIAIYLDNVRSPHNVGNILRTTEALRLGSVYFSPKTPFIDNEKVSRTALGAATLVPTFQNVPLSSLPRPLIALDTSNSAIPLSTFIFPPSFTLVLGNEEYGLSPSTLSEIDHLLEIPLLGAQNSLNIASAFAIAAARIRFN